ncbi:RrF2 family transcriptional regulator [Paenibacillus sp. GCM10027627]|uniref:RrF2 family transcriptional regulator n=1 Tax=unclassified Paenibacillus TaxID=185978 RepID=UPI00363B9248
MSVADKGIDFGPPHFKIAMHTVVRLAHKNTILSSAAIAGQVESHATFMRRVLNSLVQAGIVESRGGRDGGYRLKKQVDQLTLGEIYEAVQAGRREACDEKDGCMEREGECAEAGALLDQQLELILHEAESQTIQYLHRFTVKQVMHRIPFFIECES